MKKNIYLLMMLAIVLPYRHANAQTSFVNENSKLANPGFHSGCPVTVVDWNGDGLDDIIRLNGGHDCFVEVQQTNAQYVEVHLGDFGGGSWAMTVADVDNNGYKDVFADGAGGIGLIKTNNSGTGGTMSWLLNSGFFLQNATAADFNNDGWIDIFTCDDNAAGHIYLNDGAGNMHHSGAVFNGSISNTTLTVTNLDRGELMIGEEIISPSVIPGTTITGFMTGSGLTGTYSVSNSQTVSGTSMSVAPIIDFMLPNGSDNSGNYGSAWTDFDNDGDLDLYIAKCRQQPGGVTDPRRIDVLFVNDGTNHFTEMAATYGVANGWQTWTASFGDLDNDGDLDLLATNNDHESQIYENDGTGHYTDITATTGFDITDITPIESVMEDFDNDGYNDLLITGSDSRFYHNNGNMTFTKIDNIFNTNSMESFAIGDVNHDGFVDVYASYATIYTNPTGIDDVIWMNERNSNHFLTLNLKGTVSNIGAIGAKAFLYSSLGTQVREVRSGESYGTCNSSELHFGLGAVTSIDSVVIRWPAGGSQTIINPAADQFISIIENDCVSPASNVTASGPLVLCPGQSLDLTAPAGYSYLWSDGSTGSTLSVTTSGEYSVQVVDAGNNCTGTSPTFTIVLGPNETPTIAASSSVEFCDGESIDLAGPANALGYLWSDGSTTQTITVSQSGTYSLSIQGYCQWWPSSNSITTTVHTPVLPVANDVTLSQPGSTTLTATGNNITWYDAAFGGTLLGSGNNYITPVLNDTTVFYVQSAEIYPRTEETGLLASPGTYSTTNALMNFTAISDCILKSVKVYTDIPGNRLIELRAATGGALIDSQLVSVSADSDVVSLNFPLTAGTSYTLGTDAVTNQAIPGWNQTSPHLQRNNGGVNYPYTIQNVLSITGSNQGVQYYYFFYDWQVEYESSCPSVREPVTVFVTSSVGISDAAAAGISIYPNPASDKLYIEKDGGFDYTVSLVDQAGRVIKEERMTKSGQMDISGVAAGLYHLKLQNENSQYIYKIVVE